MKNKQLLSIALVAALIGFSSCEREGAKLYEVQVTVEYPEGYDLTVAEGVDVKASNINSGDEYTEATDAQGIVTFNLPAGEYDFTSSTETDEFYFNGTTEGVYVEPESTTFTINLIASSKSGGLIFKEIYYAGSLTEASTSYYADQFHEIYNNSDDTLYMDGLCIGVLEPSGSTASAWVDGDGNLLDVLPVTYHALMFPGTGEDYPIYPRTSVVLAQDAIDHQTDPNGNPNSPVNLGNAQFETYIEAPGKDTDAAGADNLIVMYTTSASMYDWMHSVFGSAVIIFRLPTGLDYQTFVADNSNFMTKPGSTSTTKYFMVNKDWVLDAVECINPDVNKQNKRLPVSLDAGKVSCVSTYCSKSIRRKVERILDGKVYYKDTNNSTNDFLVDCTPTPFVHPTTVDAE